MKVLLTGGTGFIGSHIAKQLSDDGHQVTIMARYANKIPALKLLPGIDIVQASLSNFELIESLVQGMDAVIHVALVYKDGAVNMLENDTLGSVHLFEAAANAGVEQIIYTSSTATCDFIYMTDYGRNEFAGKSLDENFKPRPATFYGATKAATEMYLMALSHEYPIRINIIRPGYIFGNPVLDGAPTQPDSRFKDLVKKIKNNEDVSIANNDGTQFLSARNIAKVYSKLLVSDLNRETFFVLGSKFISWERICKSLISEIGSTSNLIIEGNPSDGKTPEDFQTFGVSKLEKVLGFSFDNEWLKIQEHIRYFLGKV
jgi:UDP-glucose 4-epimerase